MSFTADLARALDRARVDYAVLVDGDNDLDLVVAPGSLRTAQEVLLRFGPIVQAHDYEVPRSRLLVVRLPDGPRYRRVDIACDPHGIGKYGTAPATALARATHDADGVRRPDAAALLVYLAVKRARKGLTPETADELADVAARAGDAGRDALRAFAGDDTADKACDALARGHLPTLERALQDIAAAVDAQLRRPSAVAARAFHETRRIVRRIARPTGFAICLAGPDGVGKSTLTQALLALNGGPFHTRIRLGQRRGFFRKPGELLRRPQADANRPHHRRPSNLAGSTARLFYMWLDALVGWLPKIGLARRRTTLVVLERPFVDFAIDPKRYRLSTPPALARALARLLPRPDLVLVLTAPARAVHARKRELPLQELERQLAAWRAEARRSGFPVLDASGAPAETFADALHLVDETLARRHGDLGPARAALELLGSPSRAGTRHRVTRRHGTTRFVIPAGSGPLRAGLYRPGRRRDALAASAVETAHRLGLGRTTLIDQETGAAPAIADALGLPRVTLSAAAARNVRRGARALLAVHDGRRLVAYAKAAASGESKLALELDVLERLAGARPESFTAPRPLGALTWEGYELLLLEPLTLHGRANRPLGRSELSALTELASLEVLPAPAGEVAVHGDFTAWNTGVDGRGRLAVVDWEHAGAGLPLEDLFQWRLQQLVLFGEGTPDGLARGALEPDRQVRELAARLGIGLEIAPGALLRAARRSGAVDGALRKHLTELIGAAA
jgi:thymidylate kinase